MNITSADAAAVLKVQQIFPGGITLEQFGADAAVAEDAIDITETRMGVDGKMVAGYTPVIHPVTVTLEASSPSFDALAHVWAAMAKAKTIYECDLIVTVPSIDRVFTWTVGVLKNGAPFPSLNKVLAPTAWLFHFEKLDVAQIG
jgi:hypothetical protein